MLMTDERPALTPLGERLLEILRGSGEWMSRGEIAREIGRPTRLTPYDVQVLEDLADDNLIQIDSRKIGAVRTEYIYRAK